MSSIEKVIIDFLDQYKDTYVPIDLVASALKMGNPRDKKRLNKTINKMIVRQMLITNKSGHIKPSINEKDSAILEGILDVNRHGTGFVSLEGYDQDIRIPGKKTGVALPGDLVRIKISGKSRSDNRAEGKSLRLKNGLIEFLSGL